MPTRVSEAHLAPMDLGTHVRIALCGVVVAARRQHQLEQV